jgi:flagella basal body P-ring formation protein FlgA
MGRRERATALFCLLVAAAVAGVATGEDEVRIVLAPAVEVDSEVVTVGHVGSIAAGSAEEAASIEGVSLGPCPPPGLSRLITREYVALRLRQVGMVLPESAFGGAEATRVTRRAVAIEVRAIEEAVRAFVARAMAGQDVEVEMYSPRVGLLAPGSNAEVTVEGTGGGTLHAGYNLLEARVVVDGAVWRTVPAHIRVRTFAPGLVAARDLAAGAAVGTGDFAVERVETSALGGRALVAPEGITLEGMRLRRFLRRGEALRTDDLEAVPPVVKGEPVVIRVVAGGVVVTCAGTAQRDGAMGEMVEVLSGYDGSRLRARVVGAGVVEISSPAEAQGGEGNAR